MNTELKTVFTQLSAMPPNQRACVVAFPALPFDEHRPARKDFATLDAFRLALNRHNENLMKDWIMAGEKAGLEIIAFALMRSASLVGTPAALSEFLQSSPIISAQCSPLSTIAK